VKLKALFLGSMLLFSSTIFCVNYNELMMILASEFGNTFTKEATAFSESIPNNENQIDENQILEFISDFTEDPTKEAIALGVKISNNKDKISGDQILKFISPFIKKYDARINKLRRKNKVLKKDIKLEKSLQVSQYKMIKMLRETNENSSDSNANTADAYNKMKKQFN
jgi:hypothetical protein